MRILLGLIFYLQGQPYQPHKKYRACGGKIERRTHQPDEEFLLLNMPARLRRKWLLPEATSKAGKRNCGSMAIGTTLFRGEFGWITAVKPFPGGAIMPIRKW